MQAARAWGERTRKVSRKVQTLDTSKLNGWLNARAFCAKTKGGRRAHEDYRRAVGARARAEEHTQNMTCMLVRLDVSQLSGWLNDDASCRELREGAEGMVSRVGRGVRVRCEVGWGGVHRKGLIQS